MSEAVKEPSWPVFGVSKQFEPLYQNQINILSSYVADITAALDIIDAEIVGFAPDLVWLNANAVTSFDVETTYDDTSCPGEPVVDVFETPVSTPNLPYGRAVVFQSRPLISSDTSVSIAYDVTCGYVNLQTDWSQLGLSSAGGAESLLPADPDFGPVFSIKGVSAGSGMTLSSTATAVTVSKATKSYRTFVTAGGTANLILAAANTRYLVPNVLTTSGPASNFSIVSSSRMTYVGVATGVFLVSGETTVSVTSATQWSVYVRFRKNGLTESDAVAKASIDTAANRVELFVSFIVSLANSDYLEIVTYTDTAGVYPVTFTYSSTDIRVSEI